MKVAKSGTYKKVDIEGQIIFVEKVNANKIQKNVDSFFNSLKNNGYVYRIEKEDCNDDAKVSVIFNKLNDIDQNIISFNTTNNELKEITFKNSEEELLYFSDNSGFYEKTGNMASFCNVVIEAI